MDWAIYSAVCLALTFFVLLLGGVVLPQAAFIFTKPLGRPHAITGATYLIWLLFGFYDSMFPCIERWKYDTMLGILGIVLTLTAAFNFGHKNVRNIASGTLDEHATVTFNEMIEHSFYQILNLIQIWYLHIVCRFPQEGQRLLLVMIATSPWLVRRYFPIHPFSANYLLHDDRSTTFIREMYRAKKYQYMFYKHFLLHGLNISVAFSGVCLCDTQIFRLYWLLLNTAYVLEFFLQTLVKKGHMNQSTMLTLQLLLMGACTAAAIRIVPHVSLFVALLSLGLNLIARQQDVTNTLMVISVKLLSEN